MHRHTMKKGEWGKWSMEKLLSELERRWQAMFTALVAGDDVPPAQRLRAEGMMEAASLLGIATSAELQASMDRCYREAIGRGLAEDCGEDWETFFPFPQIPAMAKRAPVYPSTGD
jgi:hypothetical protein